MLLFYVPQPTWTTLGSPSPSSSTPSSAPSLLPTRVRPNITLPRRTISLASRTSRPPNVATGADEETVLGAMLHDVGHLQLDVDQDESSLARMGAVGVQNHEVVGASYLLRLGFSDKVAQLVCGHVQAKVSPASSSPSSSSDLLNLFGVSCVLVTGSNSATWCGSTITTHGSCRRPASSRSSTRADR